LNDQRTNHSPEEVTSVVILVHGIRTYAPWIAMLRAEFETVGIVVEATNYGRLDALRFLWGSRRTPIDAVWDSVKDVRKLYPNAKISFLAHSFGTYIVARLLQREFDFKAHQIVFCGSVVQYGFPFNQISERFTPPLVNEASSGDPWPVIAESATWGYGSAGTYGFRVPRIRDRWHKGFGHSQYLTEEFCKKFLVPFFQEGKIVEGDLVSEAPPFLIRLFSLLSIKYVLAPLLAVGIVLAIHFVMSQPLKYPNLGWLEAFFGHRPDPQTYPSSPPSDDPGPKPRPDCTLMHKMDTTVFPQKWVPVWDCPSQ
jgi:hypothetical protein